MDRAMLHAAILVVALATAFPTYARTGFGHCSASSGNGGHGSAGHMAAHANHHGCAVTPRACTIAGDHVHRNESAAYGVTHTGRASAIDRALHKRVVKTELAKDAFMTSHPCPANGATMENCPGYVIECIDPDPADPGRCLDVSNLKWQLVQQSSP